MLISQSKIPDVSAIRKLSDESSLTKHMHTPIAMTTQILNLALSLLARIWTAVKPKSSSPRDLERQGHAHIPPYIHPDYTPWIITVYPLKF